MGNNKNKTKTTKENYRLADLVDMPLIQKLVDAHFQTANMPMAIVDAQDSSILVESGWQDICVKFHRANPLSRKRCEESDNYIKRNLAEGTPCGYKCANGLWDVGIPIIVEGRHLATLFLGQFFYEGEVRDREYFKRQAREFGYAEENYLSALDRVPVFSHEKVDYIIAYITALAGFIGDLAGHAYWKIKSDRELRFANAVLKAQQEKSPDGILVVDDEQKMISFNKRFVDMWDIPADIVESRSNDRALQSIRRVLSNPDEYSALVKSVNELPDRESFNEISLNDGRIFEQYSAPLPGPEGTYFGRVWHFRDITERKRAEEALSESEQRFSAFFQLSPITMSISSFDDGALYEVNGAFEKIFGICRDEAIGHTSLELGIYANVAEREKLTRAIREQGTVRDLELDLRHRDGRAIVGLVFSTQLLIRQEPYLLTVVSDITERDRAEKALKESNAKLQKSLNGIINAITMIVEIRDPYTAGHQKHVSLLASGIAQEMGLSKYQVNNIRIAGALHDIGKIYVPAEILSKPGTLSQVEREIIKVHPKASYDILEKIEFPWPVARIALQHQERYDGSGYPFGLSGENILLEARILAVADVVEAMTFSRPYREAVGLDRALETIINNKGIAYDPDVVDAAVRLIRDKHFEFGVSNQISDEILAAP